MNSEMKCRVPMWSGGLPAGYCDKPAYGEYIEGETFKDAWTGEVRRFDGVYRGYVSGPCCPDHGGPQKTGPRVFQDGNTENGRPMWCAVYEDFVNLQESPAEFHPKPWIAIKMLIDKHPRTEKPDAE